MSTAHHVTAASAYLAKLPAGPARTDAYAAITHELHTNLCSLGTKASRLLRSAVLKRARDTKETAVREVALVAIVHWRGLLDGSVPWSGRAGT